MLGALRTLRQVPQWVNPPEWSNEHAVKLQQFLKSETATIDGLAAIRSQPDEVVTGVTDDLEWLRQPSN